MKKIVPPLMSLMIILGLLGCNTQHRKSSLTEGKEKTSYALGLNIGSSLKQLDTDIDLDILFQAMRDTMESRGVLMNQTEFRKVITDFQNEIRLSRNKKRQEKSAENLKKSEEFLAQNKEKKGVITTASGLQYKIIKQGNGPKPKASDKVKVNYRGTTIDGKEFDSSYKRGKPATFGIKGVIKGWTEALQLMNVGSKYELYIPADLAYGANGSGPNIGPNEALIFEVELLDIVK